MSGRRAAPRIVLRDDERSELEALSRRRKTAQAMAMRARIVLACAEGFQSKQVAASRIRRLAIYCAFSRASARGPMAPSHIAAGIGD